MVLRCIIQSWFQIKSTNYLIYNVGKIFIRKIIIELENKKENARKSSCFATYTFRTFHLNVKWSRMHFLTKLDEKRINCYK